MGATLLVGALLAGNNIPNCLPKHWREAMTSFPTLLRLRPRPLDRFPLTSLTRPRTLCITPLATLDPFRTLETCRLTMLSSPTALLWSVGAIRPLRCLPSLAITERSFLKTKPLLTPSQPQALPSPSSPLPIGTAGCTTSWRGWGGE